jgi:hypothetical protein
MTWTILITGLTGLASFGLGCLDDWFDLYLVADCLFGLISA